MGLHNQQTDTHGKVHIKVFWLTSIVLSILLTLILNIIF
jgi:hypothetical protein